MFGSQTSTFTPAAHKTSHQSGGGDEISIASLAGEPTELTTHKTTTASVHGVTGAVVGTSDTQTLSNKTLMNPTIAFDGFNNAKHYHSGLAEGGQIAYTSLTSVPSSFAPSAHHANHEPGVEMKSSSTRGT